MALVVIGTVAQKYIGLFPATQKFFNSFIIWCGWLPLPGGATVITIIFLNLLLHFVMKSQWRLPQLGVTLTHLGVLVLVLGSVVSFFYKQEGFVILQQSKMTDQIYSYHDRVFTLMRNGQQIWQSADKDLIVNHDITKVDWPFVIRITRKEPNVILKRQHNAGPHEQGLAREYRLVPRKAKLEDELNQMGLLLTVTDKKTDRHYKYLLAEFMTGQQALKLNGVQYEFVLQRQSTALPFALRMEQLDQDYYIGTDVAQSYRTAFDVVEHEKEWPALVAMNAPLRYKGYTFYQASVLNLPGQPPASVFAVVRNIGWLFPYLASALIFIGLVLHAGMKRHAV